MLSKRLRGIAMLVGAVFASTCFGASALAIPSESTNNPKVGDDGYVHLNHYITPTELKDVYRVDLSVSGYIIPKPTDVIIIMDNSGSMSENAAGVQVGISGDVNGMNQNRWTWACKGAKEAIDIFLNPDKNIGANITRVALVAFGGGQTPLADRYYDGTDGLRFTTRGSSVQSNPAPDRLTAMNNQPVDGFVDITLHADLNAAIDAFPQNTVEETNMKAGIDEAKACFDAAALNHPDVLAGTPGFNYTTDVRKFVVFLSDGMDTGVAYDTMSAVDELKGSNYEATFMTIGLGLPDMNGFGSTLSYNSSTYKNWDKKHSFSSGADFWTKLMSASFDEQGGYFDIPGDQYYEVGAVEPIQQLIYMGMKLNSYASGTYSSWGMSNPLWWTGSNSVAGSINTGVGTIMGVADPSSSGYPFGSGPSAGEVIDSYNAANWSGRMPEFMLANSNSEVENAFKTYANKIIKFGDNVFTHIEIADYFNIYDGYPGMSKWYKTTGEKTQSASRSGNKVKWDLVYIPLTGANTLTFYVKIDEGKTDKDLWYFLANHSYIEYVDTQFQTGQGYVKYFPEPVVQGTGSGTTNVPGSTANGFYTPTESPSTDSGVANLGIYSFGTPIPPYTPSVTPKPTKIPTSGVDEETVENGADEDVDDNTDVDDETDNNEEEDFDINDEDTDDTDDQQDMTPPVTGQATGAVTAAILAGLAGMAMFVTYSRKREEK